MAKPFGRIERMRLADIGEIPRGKFRGDPERSGAEPRPRRERVLVRGRAYRGGRLGLEIIDARQRRRRGRQIGAAGSAEPHLTFDRELKPPVRDLAGHDRRLAVIDRREEPAFRAAALEPGPSPLRDRQVCRVRVDLDSGHEAAGKAEPPRHRVVMNLVFRGDRGVASPHAIRRQVKFGQSSHPPRSPRWSALRSGTFLSPADPRSTACSADKRRS